MSNVVLRRARLNDAKDIANIYRSDLKGFANILRGIPDKPETVYRFGGVWMHKDSCREHIALIRNFGGEVFVAEIDNRVVGHIEVLFDETKNLGKYAYIYTLMVHADYRRKGIGSKLVSIAQEHALDNGLKRIVVIANEGSANFYRRIGFKICDEWVNIYVPSKDYGLQYDIISSAEAIDKIRKENYEIIVGRFHGVRTLIFELTTKYRSLENLDLRYLFFKAIKDNAELIMSVRISKDIPNIFLCWVSDYVELDTILKYSSQIAHDFCIPKILTCVPKENSRFEVVENLIWMIKDLA